VKVLLVDDRRENLFTLESLLDFEGVEFHRALSGVEALELLLRNEFALAIVDVQMPEMDGFELAELMRGTERTRSVPIIFVTAGARDRLSSFKGYEKGAVDFLYKPLDPHIVKCKVHVFLELARQRQLLQAQLEETQRVLQERDRALEQAREALQTRDEFLSIASHELKTPLTSLYLQLQILMRYSKMGGDSSRFLKNIELCERQCGKLSGLLDELLDLTRVRVGKLRLTKSPVDLVELTNEIVRRFAPDNGDVGAPISFVSAAPSIRGHWDPTRIEQVVTNLVSNAVKYGNSQPIRITLTPTEDSARLVVQDRGIGIPEELQGKIFERFERAVEGDRISGLGLGLYISRQIVRAHGGEISVQSRMGEGSVFTVVLPCRSC
jgi:signal transduction histidine kinase